MNERQPTTFDYAIAGFIAALFITLITIIIIKEVKKNRNNILSDKLEHPSKDDIYTTPMV